MRQAGTLDNQADAQRFAAYLVTQDVLAHAEEDGDEWAIWVRDENHIAKAKEALADFRSDRDNPRYSNVEREAESRLAQERERRQQAAKNVQKMGGQWNRGGSVAPKRAPLVFVMIGASVMATVWTNMAGDPVKTAPFRFLRISSISPEAIDAASRVNGPAAFTDIFAGQIWRLVTPIFLHGGPLHLLFNMYWLYRFGAQIENAYGSLFFAFLAIGIAVGSNCAQAFIEHAVFVGMSGVAFGVFGYVWVKTLFDPKSRVTVAQGTSMFVLTYLFACMTGFLGPIANTAHFVGLGIGAAAAYLPLATKAK